MKRPTWQDVCHDLLTAGKRPARVFMAWSVFMRSQRGGCSITWSFPKHVLSQSVLDTTTVELMPWDKLAEDSYIILAADGTFLSAGVE